MSYTILTAKQAAHLQPEKFCMPPKAAVQMLVPGNLVLIMVDYINKTSGRPQAEPIWCVVLRRKKDKLVIAVWPDPPPKKMMHHGIMPKTLLTVTLDNILDIRFEAEAPKKEFRII